VTVNPDELHERIGYHRATEQTAPKHDAVRKLIERASVELLEHVPAGREQATALTKLQEAGMWANAGVARLAPLVDGPEAAQP
jgi:hypothetical protein